MHNADQISFWNGDMAANWVEHDALMEAMLAPLGASVLDTLTLSAGTRVLDVGCGCGHSTLSLAQRIGPDGSVTGIDVSAPMLALAEQLAKENTAERATITFLQADAQTHSFDPESLDGVFSRFGVMFFEDSYAAFKNIYTSIKQGGQLAFVCWQNPSLNPWQSLSIGVIKDFLDLPSPPPKSPGPFAFEDKSYLLDILQTSNFRNIEIIDNQEDITMFSGKTLKEACEDYLTINPVVTEMLKNSNETLKEEILNALMDKFSAFDKGDGLLFPSATWVVSASK